MAHLCGLSVPFVENWSSVVGRVTAVVGRTDQQYLEYFIISKQATFKKSQTRSIKLTCRPAHISNSTASSIAEEKPTYHPIATMASSNKEVLTDLSPGLKYYTDGTVERLLPYPYAPPSLTGPVSSKDIIITPSISARIYRREPLPGTDKLPILLYFHGGGFCINSAFSSRDHHYLTQLSSQSQALIITVEYRLAPEHLLPAAYEDSWTALNWLCSHSLDLHDQVKEPWIVDHGDLTKIFVGGDSAGANIAYNLAMRAGSEPLPGNLKIFGALLSHPEFWGSKRPGEEHLREDLGEHIVDKIWVLVYPNAPGGYDDPVINPINGEGAPSLTGLGCEKVMVCLSEKDELTVWGLAFVEKLKGSGWKGEVEVVEVEGEGHCFQWLDPDTDMAKNLIKKMADFISQ